MNKSTHPFRLGRKMKPTLKHRPAIWECMLGTVYAMNDEGEVKYFDYKWDDAVEFAGVTEDRDPRVFRCLRVYAAANQPRPKQYVLYVTR